MLYMYTALTQFRDPLLDTNADDNFSVQPFASYPSGVTNASSTAYLSTTPPTNLVTSTAPPPPPSSSSSQDRPPPPGSGGSSSNPYRIGTGFGSRKPAYGTSGIASFSSTVAVGPSVSQPLTQQAPMMVPAQPAQPPPQASWEMGFAHQAPPTSVAGGPGPSLYQSGPSEPPTGVPTQTGAPPAHIVEPQLSGGGWDQSSQPVRYHWFYLRSGEKYWIPFSLVDSHRLEQSVIQHQNTSEEVSGKGKGGLDVRAGCCKGHSTV